MTSLQAGLITSGAAPDVLAATYAGKVVAWSSSGSAGAEGDRAAAEKKKAPNQANAGELDRLRAKIDKARAQYTAMGTEAIGSGDQFRVNAQFTLADGAYVLALEIQSPIDTVILHADCKVDVKQDTSRNEAIFGETRDEGKLLATLRCQEDVNRIEVALGTREGQAGTLAVYIMPKQVPKTSQVLRWAIKPLSLHQRVGRDEIDEAEEADEADGHISRLVLSGAFSLADVHSWVVACLPDMPDRVHGDTCAYAFRSTYLDTFLTCEYRKGDAVFRSDSLNTIAIVKDVVTRDATAKKIQVDVDCRVGPAAARYLLNKIHPLLGHQLSLARKVKLIEPLRELQLQEEGEEDVGAFLEQRYKDILDSQEDIRAAFASQPQQVDALTEMIVQLHKNAWLLKGVRVDEGKVERLRHAVERWEEEDEAAEEEDGRIGLVERLLAEFW